MVVRLLQFNILGKFFCDEVNKNSCFILLHQEKRLSVVLEQGFSNIFGAIQKLVLSFATQALLNIVVRKIISHKTYIAPLCGVNFQKKIFILHLSQNVFLSTWISEKKDLHVLFNTKCHFLLCDLFFSPRNVQGLAAQFWVATNYLRIRVLRHCSVQTRFEALPAPRLVA